MSDQWKCETCRYFRGVVMPDEPLAGFCKRYPVQWTGSNWTYPVVPGAEWCGEWKPLNTPA